MLTTGNQLKAARALADMDQATLAAKAKVSPNTISNMETQGAKRLTSGLDAIHAISKALEAAGVELLNDGQPGARLAPP